MTWKKWSNMAPDGTGEDTENTGQSTSLLHDVLVRKGKMMKKPSLNWEISWSFVVKVAVLEKLLWMRHV